MAIALAIRSFYAEAGRPLWRKPGGKGLKLAINTTILNFLLIGPALLRTPIAHADTIRRAARLTGSMLLQYPMYGGIIGIMRGTGAWRRRLAGPSLRLRRRSHFLC
jgi:short subunit fatty acids transporter